MKDLSTGEISIASTSKDGEIGNGYSNNAIFSFDGTKIAFESTSSNLADLVSGAGDSNNEYDVFIKDLSTGEISLVSQTEGGIQPNVHARLTGLTADGSAVSFTSYADNIDVAGHDGMSVFVTPTAIEFNRNVGPVSDIDTTANEVPENVSEASVGITAFATDDDETLLPTH